jgi:hypothetical protein
LPFTFCLFTSLALPVVLDLLCEQGEGDVLGLASGAAQFFDHSDGSVGVARVDEDGRGALQMGLGGEPEGDGVARPFIVQGLRAVVLGQKIVV